MIEDKASSFLRMIRRARRGKLKVYLGYAAGVGKTYQMLQEGHRLKAEGIDVVVGLVETHGRAETAKLIQRLEVLPRRVIEYHGIAVEEMDLQAVLARRPQVALIDEIAHTNVPDIGNAKRYEDIMDLLAAGIHVITTLNVQHLESLYETVEKATGVKVRERLPDWVISEADQVVNVDLSIQDLQIRLEEGKVYPREQIESAMEHFFRTEKLDQLRELTLRELVSQIDFRRRESRLEETTAAPDQVMVCLSSRGPDPGSLVRYGYRLAGKLNRNWYAVYIQTAAEDGTRMDAQTQRQLSETLELARELGAIILKYKGQDVIDTILQFAKEYLVGHIVIGRSGPKTFWQRALHRPSLAERLISKAKGYTVVVVDTEPESSSR